MGSTWEETTHMKRDNSCTTLPDTYQEFYRRIRSVIPEDRLLCGPLQTLAYGTDASFYRLIPKIVAKARTEREVSDLLKTAFELKTPVTFRAAGTSLAGQAISDSILVYLAGGWRGYAIKNNGAAISLQPGVIGGDANFYLAPLGKKIGPDPASINAAMIGGIAANNASGMCCGTAENSYKTVESMRLVFADGSILDTADAASREAFRLTHKELITDIERMRDEIRSDHALSERIRRKFKIKNTTGYGINAFVDFEDPFDIVVHLMIGSEGTLGFISEITYRTVIEHKYKASSLIIFPHLENACHATIRLKQGPSSAVELMDRPALRSVEDKAGMPSFLKELGENAAALLVETRASDTATLLKQIEELIDLMTGIPTVYPITFMDKPEDYNKLWNIRKGLFPSVGGARKIGTTVVIEDVVFPIEKLSEGTLELQSLMQKHGYPEGIIFGHALEGNLHFVFCPDLADPDSVRRYKALLDEVCDMVVRKYDGSLKGEHGTGRNMAPFVELEWGHQAYTYMQRLKKAFDPRNILNPGVIINDNPNVYIENLKPMPAVSDIVDKCIECGFCEPVCPSKSITTTPRQRITTQREIARLRAAHEDDELLKQLLGEYRYYGEQTCAADGLCATVCPVGINTGDFTKQLRSAENTEGQRKIAQWIVDHYATVVSLVRTSLSLVNVAHSILGTSLMSSISQALRSISGGKMPLWNPFMPKGAKKTEFRDIQRSSDRKVVYFPTCIVRAMGPAKSDPDQRELYEATLSVLEKAGYSVIFPKNLDDLCCGMSFSSKGFTEQAGQQFKLLEKALRDASNNGTIPILIENGSCTYTIKSKIDPSIRLYEPVEFVHDFLLDKLNFTKQQETVAVHVTCSSTKMGLAQKWRTVAAACAEKTLFPKDVTCCGFAGDRGFLFPELNEAALSGLKPALPADCRSGVSNARTCEIGLSLHGGINYQSVMYLVDRCTTPK